MGVMVVALAFAGGHGVLACGINAEKTIGLGEMMKFRLGLAALTGRVGRSTGDPAAPQLLCRPRVRHHGAHQIRTRARTGLRCSRHSAPGERQLAWLGAGTRDRVTCSFVFRHTSRRRRDREVRPPPMPAVARPAAIASLATRSPHFEAAPRALRVSISASPHGSSYSSLHPLRRRSIHPHRTAASAYKPDDTKRH